MWTKNLNDVDAWRVCGCWHDRAHALALSKEKLHVKPDKEYTWKVVLIEYSKGRVRKQVGTEN